MSSAMTSPDKGGVPGTEQKQDRSELGIVALLVVLGVLVIYNASQLSTNIATTGPVGPKVVPYIVGGLLLVVAAMLAVDVLRGGHGEPEGGEDVDLSTGADWKTVALLAVAFLSNAVLIERVGWPVSGAIMFFVAAYALGSRHVIRDVILSVALSIGTWYLFVLTLGINLPVGLLDGIL
jgi:putative tricarboxylic transport membrane protein